jgi:hypothetical protein
MDPISYSYLAPAEQRSFASSKNPLPSVQILCYISTACSMEYILYTWAMVYYGGGGPNAYICARHRAAMVPS